MLFELIIAVTFSPCELIMPNKLGKHKAHILFIVENNTVPPDIRVWREAQTARKAGYMVSVIAPVTANYRKKYEVIEGIEIYRHPNFEHKGGVKGQVIEYLNAFFWEMTIACKLFMRCPFTIIHAANPPDNLFIIGLLFKVFGVKFIFDHHDISPELFISKYQGSNKIIFSTLRLLEKFSCKTADTIISTNNSFRNHVIKNHKINPENVAVVRNDPEVVGIRTPKRNSGDNINLLFVGAINVQDGVDLLVRIIHILVTRYRHENIKCTVVGDGDALESSKQLADDLGIEQFFEFTGYIYDRQQVKKYMQNADICVEPAPDNAANRRSTFIKIMEYMSFGKPIVAFDLKETRTSTGKCAILIEPGDTDAFARTIHELISDPLERIRIGNLAQKRILKQLNWENSSAKLKKVYAGI